ncbi:MAG: hypothetical protein ABIH24_00950 [Verrucomicrobiota bacterium]
MRTDARQRTTDVGPEKREKNAQPRGTRGKLQIYPVRRGTTEEGRRKKEDGRRKTEEGRRKKEDGRRKKEDGIDVGIKCML